MTTSMPLLSIVRRPWLDTRRLIQRFSLGTQKRRSCRFGSQRRLVLLLAWETLLPESAFFPVTWQTLDMRTSSIFGPPLARTAAAQRRRCATRCWKGLGRTTRADRVTADPRCLRKGEDR